MARSVLLRRLKRLLASVAAESEMTSYNDHSRRDFLKKAAGATLLAHPVISNLACSTVTSSPFGREPASELSKNLSPVVILGGGIAGLSAAYKLAQNGYACQVFEASERLGGRMFTKANFNKSGMFCELGGELVDSNHDSLISLCHDLGIKLDAFITEDKSLEQNLYYFNNQHYTDRDVINGFRNIAKKLKKDVALASASPTNRRKMDEISLDRYLETLKDEADSWLIEMLKVAYVSEEGLEAAELSCLNLIDVLSPNTTQGFKLYGDSDEAYRIRGGNRALIDTLEEVLTKKGVAINRDYQLTALRDSPSGLNLNFANGKSFTAEKVICTIPFSTLRDVDGIFALDLSKQKKECIRYKAYGTNSKMILGYQERLWHKGLKNVYPPSNGMVYTDTRIQNIWDSSRRQTGTPGILTAYSGGTEGLKLEDKFLQSYLAAIDQIFPGSAAAYDNNFVVSNWARNPFTKGSYGTGRAGDETRFGHSAYQPELSGRLHFAGEHATPKFPGFMNGGCYSGLRAARAVMAG